MWLRTVLTAVFLLSVSVGSASAQANGALSLRDALSGARPGGGRAATPPPVARYVAGEDEAFVLDRSGEAPLLMFENQREVWALRATPGPRGDVIYKDDLGRPVLRSTRLGGLTVFTPESPSGLPAAPTGPVAALRPGVMTAVQLWRHLVRQSARASRALGRRIDFVADDVGQGSEALYADAASLTAEAISRGVPHARPQSPLRKLRRVEFVEGARASAALAGDSLTVMVSPQDGWAGRPSSERVLTALEAD